MQSENVPSSLNERKVAPVNPTTADKNRLRSHLAAARLGGAVALMLGSPRHRNMPLGMLRRCLIPAMSRGQMSLVEAGAPESGETAPVALILWAKVSDETHARLLKDLDKAMILDPEEWSGGENYWIIDAIGPERFVAPAIRSLRKGAFKDKIVHFRARESESENAPLVVKTLEPLQG